MADPKKTVEEFQREEEARSRRSIVPKNKAQNSFMFVMMLMAGLIIAFGIWTLIRGGGLKGPAKEIVISIADEEIYRGKAYITAKEIRLDTVSKNDDYITVYPDYIEVRTENGYNLVKAQCNANGTLGVCCIEADCPEQVCVNTGIIVFDSENIVCLPHRMTVRLAY